MRLFKVFIVLALINLFQFVVLSCCESFRYRWTGIILEIPQNGALSARNIIKQSDFWIKVNLMDEKRSRLVTNFSNNLMAQDCFPIYLHDSIVSIKIKQIKLSGGVTVDVTDRFVGSVISKKYQEEYESISELIKEINGDGEFIYLFELKPKNDMSIVGVSRFIVEIALITRQNLTDITNIVEIN